MTPAPLQHFKHGYRFQQVTRRGRVAIYEQQAGTTPVAYEVVVIRVVKETHMFGKTVPAHEKLPGDHEWGRYGWTFSTFGGVLTIDAALAKAESKLVDVSQRLKD